MGERDSSFAFMKAAATERGRQRCLPNYTFVIVSIWLGKERWAALSILVLLQSCVSALNGSFRHNNYINHRNSVQHSDTLGDLADLVGKYKNYSIPPFV